MLKLFRRHSRNCPHRSKGRDWRKCNCPINVQGTLKKHDGSREVVKRSLTERNWESAETAVHKMTNDALLPPQEQKQHVAVKDAIDKFLKDAKARNLTAATISKFRVLLEKHLQNFCIEKGLQNIRELDSVEVVSAFRESWTDEAITQLKKLERLRSFFRFCQTRKYIDDNPAAALKPPKVPDNPTLPFTDIEMEKILWACDLFSAHGRYRAVNRTRVKAVVLLMRYSGLAIRDAVTLERKRITGNLLSLHRAKTGVLVKVPLPDKVLSALNELNDYTERFFWNGAGKIESVVGVWERTFKRLFQIAGIEGAHSHRFRDTFAVELLRKEVPMDRVSILLGHSSIKTTERHYAPWVQSRQDELEKAVRLTWD